MGDRLGIPSVLDLYFCLFHLFLLTSLMTIYILYFKFKQRCLFKHKRSKKKDKIQYIFLNFLIIKQFILDYLKEVIETNNKHWWFSGRMLACHAGGPGSIPGQCIFIIRLNFNSIDKRQKKEV